MLTCAFACGFCPCDPRRGASGGRQPTRKTQMHFLRLNQTAAKARNSRPSVAKNYSSCENIRFSRSLGARLQLVWARFGGLSGPWLEEVGMYVGHNRFDWHPTRGHLCAGFGPVVVVFVIQTDQEPVSSGPGRRPLHQLREGRF